MSRTIVITGASGQDGAYLAMQALSRGVSVVGTRRPGSGAESLWRLRELGVLEHPQLRLVELDITDGAACCALLGAVQPFALFHLAAQTRVAASFRDPLATAQVNGFAALHLLDAVRRESAHTRFVLASTAELFGDPQTSPQNEVTPLAPRNPYAVAKQFAHAMTQSYRAGFGLHAGCAILFNHESPLRDADFVTRKIAAAAARLSNAAAEPLKLGNLQARRDFGYAPEYTATMLAMAEQAQPDDYVLATGVATSIRDFVDFAFAAAGIELDWRGHGAGEHAVGRRDGRVLVTVQADLFRPLDAAALTGDAAKARARLGFAPLTDVRALARLLVEAELRRLR
ncbi:MAG: GDP-mannose 4,6-dehydratase [Rudaea sp.]|nr:GDP-mannose 4,6-dehydratase [Rudaea sp.]